jgi:capsid protein
VLGWLTNLFSSKPPTTNRAVRMVRAKYDAAATNSDNRRHWANADGLSANAANSPEVRRVLRNRARYEIANNSYARGISLTLANDVVGTGPRLQLLTADSEANGRIEQAFMQWSKAVGLAEKLRTMRLARASDGEAFGILTSNPALPTAIQLDVRLVEADQVCTPDLFRAEPNSIDGIVFDAAGNPTEYHVLREHPGDVTSLAARNYDRVPAESMIHWFRADRPGQARGIPDFMPALPLFAQLRRFTLAVLAAAETAADFAGILYTDAPANGEADAAEPFEPIELEKRALLTMPGGWKMSQMEAEQPATTYGEFKRELLNEICRCLNMPYKDGVQEAELLITTRFSPQRARRSRNCPDCFVNYLGNRVGQPIEASRRYRTCESGNFVGHTACRLRMFSSRESCSHRTSTGNGDWHPAMPLRQIAAPSGR